MTNSFYPPLSGHCIGLIRYLKVIIIIGIDYPSPKGIGSRGINASEWAILGLRSSVRKLAEYLDCSETHIGEPDTTLKCLTVVSEVSPYQWSLKAATYGMFLVLEPPQLIYAEQIVLEGPIADRAWKLTYNTVNQISDISGSMRSSNIYGELKAQLIHDFSARSSTSRAKFDPSPAIRKFYQKIEGLIRQIYSSESTPARNWIINILSSIERAIHMARVAYEHDDEEMMDRVRHAIKLRWINAYRRK